MKTADCFQPCNDGLLAVGSKIQLIVQNKLTARPELCPADYVTNSLMPSDREFCVLVNQGIAPYILCHRPACPPVSRWQ